MSCYVLHIFHEKFKNLRPNSVVEGPQIRYATHVADSN